jgi:hypothetical protein
VATWHVIHVVFCFLLLPLSATHFLLKCHSSPILFCSGNYDVLEDDESAEDVSVTLKDERQRVLWKSVPGESEGTFELHVNKGGRFSLCLLNNGDKEDGERTVGFALRVRGRSRALGDKEQGPDGEKALELISWAEELTEEWHTLLDHYDYLRSREAVHEELGDKIFKRVMRWTLVEAGLLVTIACAQVMYFRAFFEKRRYL